MEIYQGHGSCFILGYQFFEKHDSLFAPTFLMNEEFFLAFQLKKAGQTIYYSPEIQVSHIGHASLSKLPSKKLWTLSSQSHRIYRKYLKLYNTI
jgi:GT2 family glycosyltransferase